MHVYLSWTFLFYFTKKIRRCSPSWCINPKHNSDGRGYTHKVLCIFSNPRHPRCRCNTLMFATSLRLFLLPLPTLHNSYYRDRCWKLRRSVVDPPLCTFETKQAGGAHRLTLDLCAVTMNEIQLQEDLDQHHQSNSSRCMWSRNKWIPLALASKASCFTMLVVALHQLCGGDSHLIGLDLCCWVVSVIHWNSNICVTTHTRILMLILAVNDVQDNFVGLWWSRIRFGEHRHFRVWLTCATSATSTRLNDGELHDLVLKFYWSRTIVRVYKK